MGFSQKGSVHTSHRHVRGETQELPMSGKTFRPPQSTSDTFWHLSDFQWNAATTNGYVLQEKWEPEGCSPTITRREGHSGLGWWSAACEKHMQLLQFMVPLIRADYSPCAFLTWGWKVLTCKLLTTKRSEEVEPRCSEPKTTPCRTIHNTPHQLLISSIRINYEDHRQFVYPVFKSACIIN